MKRSAVTNIARMPGAANENALSASSAANAASWLSITARTALASASDTSVAARDGEGNLDATPASWSWTITASTVPASVSCGQLITQSVLVQNDLLDCLGDGLVVGASNITIDLNGHTLDGTGLGAGVLNNGFDNVTITNGTIQEFDFGVQLNAGTSLNVISAYVVFFGSYSFASASTRASGTFTAPRFALPAP